MAAILWASGDQLGGETTGPWVKWLITTLFGAVSDVKIDLIHRALRKLGHVVAYGLLSWLALRAARATAQEHRADQPRWKLRWAVLALGIVLLTSGSDELLQSYTKERTGTFRDVALDCFGAILAQGALLVAAKRKR
ncbi:MAG TPA: VanZ family protein [Terriglobales bacterium]|nr:VanZ family protein [Terriglobales bacterium]